MLDNACENGSPNRTTSSTAVVNGSGVALKRTYVPMDTENVDIFRLLDELEELPERARKLPLVNVMAGFNHEQFSYLVLKIRANLPDDMKKAQRVARDSERIVDEAKDAAVRQLESGREEAARVVASAREEGGALLQRARDEANRILDQARTQAAHMVEKSEVHQAATSASQEMLRRAETEASEIRKGADEYAKDVLGNLEGVLGRALSTVQRGRESLESARG